MVNHFGFHADLTADEICVQQKHQSLTQHVLNNVLRHLILLVSVVIQCKRIAVTVISGSFMFEVGPGIKPKILYNVWVVYSISLLYYVSLFELAVVLCVFSS